MKKIILVSLLISSLLVSTVYAGGGHGGRYGGGINPLWIPVAVLSTLAVATTVATLPSPVVYDRRVYYEPRQTVVYEEPRRAIVYEEPSYYRGSRHYSERRADYYYHDDRGRNHYSSRYVDYR